MIELSEEYPLYDIADYIKNNVKLLIIGPQNDERTCQARTCFKNIKTLKIIYDNTEKTFYLEIINENYTKRKCDPSVLHKILSGFNLYNNLIFENIMLDITSLQVFTIMVLLNALSNNIQIRPAQLFTSYVKPKRYLLNGDKQYEFTKQFSHPSSIPGFATRTKKNEILIPMLGFEGKRLINIIGESKYDEVRPIIGLPSDDPSWQFYTIKNSMITIKEQKAEGNIEKCRANSIYSAYRLLEKIVEAESNKNFVVAPIGTKPHAVAAALFSLKHKNNCRIIYDNAVENYDQSSGISDIIITHISYLL